MSEGPNIHGLDGLGRYEAPGDDEANQAETPEVPDFVKGLFSDRQGKGPPREEKLWSMLRRTLTPTLTWKHFVSIMSIIHFVSMIACAVLSVQKYQALNDQIFLGPVTETLYMVNKNPY